MFIETDKESEEDKKILKKAGIKEDEDDFEYVKKMEISDILKERGNW